MDSADMNHKYHGFGKYSPVSPQAFLILAAAFFALPIANCLASALLFSAKSTPYDHQMARIQPVLNTPALLCTFRSAASLVNHWIGELRAIPYQLFNGMEDAN